MTRGKMWRVRGGYVLFPKGGREACLFADALSWSSMPPRRATAFHSLREFLNKALKSPGQQEHVVEPFLYKLPSHQPALAVVERVQDDDFIFPIL